MQKKYNITLAPMQKIIKLTKKNDNIIVCGFSIKFKQMIQEDSLRAKYILDNCDKLQGKSFLGKSIISQDDIKHIKTPTIIIQANAHIRDFLLQITKLNIKCKIFVEYTKEIMGTLFPNVSFLLEMPKYINPNSIYRKMCAETIPLILKNIVTYNIPINTIVEANSYDRSFMQRNPTQNQMLFSFHSIGNEKFNILRYKEGYLHENLTYDTKGYSGFASKICKQDVMAISSIKAKKEFDFYANKYTKNNLSKYTQPEEKNIQLPKKYVFFATQKIEDTVMELSFFNPLDLTKSLINRFSKQKDISLVIKRHPSCKNEKMKKILEKASKIHNIHVVDASIHTLIKNAKAVYAINSGVGFEALLHLKPVVLFGKSDYESACFTCKDLDKLNLTPKLTTKKIQFIKQFISYYMQERNFLINDEQKIKQIITKSLVKFFTHLPQKEYKCKVKIYI